jgi:phycoerythrin-associated linker protein
VDTRGSCGGPRAELARVGGSEAQAPKIRRTPASPPPLPARRARRCKTRSRARRHNNFLAMPANLAFLLGAAGPVPLTSGVSAVCGSRASTAAATRPARGQAAVAMTGSPGITLQTLLYEPNTTVSSASDKDLMVTLIYRQVFGNAYIMSEEIADLYAAQSMYRAGQITVREFVRACALSETYRRRFFACCGAYRAVELNFKHLLGRGPATKAELAEHVRRTVECGYEADINSYIDSAEYEERFGEDYVPGMKFRGTYPSSADFTSMCSVYSSPGTSDKSLTGRAREMGVANANHCLSLDGAGVPPKCAALAAGLPAGVASIKRAIPSRPDLDFGVNVGDGLVEKGLASAKRKGVRRVEISTGNYMYLAPQEAEAYARRARAEAYGASLAKSEAALARKEIARLQARIALSSQSASTSAGAVQPVVPFTNEKGEKWARVAISMGNYMTVTPEQAAVHVAEAQNSATLAGRAESETATVRAEIARLQARLKMLSAVV